MVKYDEKDAPGRSDPMAWQCLAIAKAYAIELYMQYWKPG